MKNVCLVIDPQIDFTTASGALYVPDAHEAFPNIQKLMDSADEIVVTLDNHPPEHKSFSINIPPEVLTVEGKPIDSTATSQQVKYRGDPPVEETVWRRHCVRGSEGAKLDPRLNFGLRALQVTKGENPELDSYSGFADNIVQGHKVGFTKLYPLLDSVETRRLFVVGFALEYCWKFSALDSVLRRDGEESRWTTFAVYDATKPIDPSTIPVVLSELERAGCILVTTEQALQLMGELPQSFYEIWTSDIQTPPQNEFPLDQVPLLHQLVLKQRSLEFILQKFGCGDLAVFLQLFKLRDMFYTDFQRIMGAWTITEVDKLVGDLIESMGDYLKLGKLLNKSIMQVKAMVAFLLFYNPIKLVSVLGASVKFCKNLADVSELILAVHQGEMQFIEESKSRESSNVKLEQYSKQLYLDYAAQNEVGAAANYARYERTVKTPHPSKQQVVLATVAQSPRFGREMQAVYGICSTPPPAQLGAPLAGQPQFPHTPSQFPPPPQSSTPLVGNLAAAGLFSTPASIPAGTNAPPTAAVPPAGSSSVPPAGLLRTQLPAAPPMNMPEAPGKKRSDPEIVDDTPAQGNMTKRQRQEFLMPKDPINLVDGVGPEQYPKLTKLGLKTIQDVADAKLLILKSAKIAGATKIHEACQLIVRRSSQLKDKS